MSEQVNYKISTYKSKFAGYQSKKGIRNNENISGNITCYISNLWRNTNNFEHDFDEFVKNMMFVMLEERICLERAFQKIILKNRCSVCAPNIITMNMMNYIKDSQMKAIYIERLIVTFEHKESKLRFQKKEGK